MEESLWVLLKAVRNLVMAGDSFSLLISWPTLKAIKHKQSITLQAKVTLVAAPFGKVTLREDKILIIG